MSKQKVPFWRTPSGWSAIGLITAASYFLLVEHGEPTPVGLRNIQILFQA